MKSAGNTPVRGGVCPIAMVQAGVWGRLSHREARAYGVLIGHANAFTGAVAVSVATIARESGFQSREARTRRAHFQGTHPTGAARRRAGLLQCPHHQYRSKHLDSNRSHGDPCSGQGQTGVAAIGNRGRRDAERGSQ